MLGDEATPACGLGSVKWTLTPSMTHPSTGSGRDALRSLFMRVGGEQPSPVSTYTPAGSAGAASLQLRA